MGRQGRARAAEDMRSSLCLGALELCNWFQVRKLYNTGKQEQGGRFQAALIASSPISVRAIGNESQTVCFTQLHHMIVGERH